MKNIAVVGIGMGRNTMTLEALEAVRQADVLVGAERMLAEFSDLGKTAVRAYLADDVIRAVEDSPAGSFAVLFSGDVGFYSGATRLCREWKDASIRLYPGLSSVVYFFSRCGRPWQNAKLISCHGLDTDIVSAVRRNRETFALTGGNVPALADALCRAGYSGLTVTVGSDLSGETESIRTTTVEKLKEEEWPSLTVLLIDNPDPDARVRTGIPDEEFERSSVPMTKSEVRAVCLSKLGIRPGEICYDVGCGTGSVTVEMALAAYEGRVYAFDKKEEAVALTEQNCARFHIGNVTASVGMAPEVFSSCPDPDAVFIGGSSGNLREIMAILYRRNPRVRFVVTAVSLETVHEAMRGFGEIGRTIRISEIGVTRTRRVAGLHMFDAQNPIYVMYDGE